MADEPPVPAAEVDVEGPDVGAVVVALELPGALTGVLLQPASPRAVANTTTAHQWLTRGIEHVPF